MRSLISNHTILIVDRYLLLFVSPPNPETWTLLTLHEGFYGVIGEIEAASTCLVGSQKRPVIAGSHINEISKEHLEPNNKGHGDDDTVHNYEKP